MPEDSVWRTWKPYAAMAAAVVGAIWWYPNQSQFAQLKDGEYRCEAVFVNAAGKFELLTNEGEPLGGITAVIQDGELVDLSGGQRMPAEQLVSLTLRKRGDSHFHVTDDPAPHSYNAIACSHVDA
jgi:hypothetical protein